MNRKILMRVTKTIIAAAVGSAFAITMIAGVKIDSSAQGLTQTTDASKVVYSNVSASEIELLKSIFDFDYYKTQNPELVGLLGDNYNALFEHFYKYGLFEGRTCNANFDPAAYASAYSDLKSAFGTDILSYYKHYVTEGKNDPNRQITTLKACADNGITVQAITNPEVKITPQLYRVAEKFGTTNYAAVSNVVERAIVEAAAVGGTAVISNGEESVVITDDGSSSSETSTQAADNTDSSNAPQSSSDSTANGSSESSGDSQQSSDTTGGGSAAVNVLDGYQITKTLTVGDYSTNFTIEIYRGSTGGYGAWGVTSIYSAENPSTSTELMDKTEGYTYSDPTDDGYGGYERSENNGIVGYGDKVASVSCSAYSMGSSSSSSEGEAESGIGIGVYASDATGSKIDGNIIQNTGTSRTETSEWEGGSETYTMIVDPDGTTDTVYGVGVNLEETDTGVEATVAVGGSDGYGLEESFDVQDNTSGNG